MHPYVEAKVIDPDGVILPIGESGELCFRGYNTMIGYWNDPEKTKEAIDEQGWFYSGDLGTIDEDGYVSIVGRVKDLIIRGGENVYPAEVEEFMLKHENVSDAQVVGVHDEKMGEELCLWVRLKDKSKQMGAQDVKAHCGGKIAHFKIPRYVRVVDEFPLSVTGKVKKNEMRDISNKILKEGLENMEQ